MIEIFQVDAFTDRLFRGNPASVVLLAARADDTWMQDVATETNVSDTAFVVPTPNPHAFEIRWFTPGAEVPLCGHATLAAAWVLFERLPEAKTLRFDSKSGELRVSVRDDGRLELDFPERSLSSLTNESVAAELAAALGRAPTRVLTSGVNLVAVFDAEVDVTALVPDMTRLAAIDVHGVVVTARGDSVDFVSRYFAPAIGVNEDPVTGSAHCELAPYWAKELGRNDLRARQISRRSGELLCTVAGPRVRIAGFVAPFSRGTIAGPPDVSLG